MQDISVITASIEYIEENLFERIGLEQVARAAFCSKYHLHRVFTSTVGISIHDYVQRRQLTEAAKLLVFSDKPILDVALNAGYGSQQAFGNVFKQMYKMTPHQFRVGEDYYPLQLAFKFEERQIPSKAPRYLDRDISFATNNDIPAWMDLVRLVIDGFPHLDEDEYLVTLKQMIREQRALIMKRDGKAIGIMVICYDTGSIDFLGVHPLYRKQGVGKAFLDKALNELMRDKEISTTTFRAGDRADTGHRKTLKELGFAEAELLVEFGYPTQRMVLLNQEPPGGN